MRINLSDEPDERNENNSALEDESKIEKPSKKRPEVRLRIEEIMEARRFRDEFDIGF
jgi:hypothetical protein